MFAKTKMISEKKKLQFCLEIVTCDPVSFQVFASIKKEEFISALNGSASAKS